MKFYISGYIWDDWHSKYMQYQIDTEQPEELDIYFDSHGGNPVAAGAIAEVIRKFNGKKTAYGIGFVQSAAVIPFLAVPAENRFLAKTADVLLHRLRTNVFSLTAEEMAQASEEASKYEAELIDLHAKALGKTVSEMAEIMKSERHLTAAEAVEMGLAAGIIGDSAEPAKMAGMTMCSTMSVKAGTEAGTDDGTEDGTDDGTEAGTDDGTEAGTDDGTEAGTDDGTEDGTKASTELQSVMILAKYADDEFIRKYASGKIKAADFVLAIARKLGRPAAGGGALPVVESEFFGGDEEVGGGSKRQEYINQYNADKLIQGLFHHGAEKYADFREAQEKKQNKKR